MMKICIVGKYPPIEGGVSATTYWLARGLAECGHQVHVVTNADEVEGAYRLALTAEDARWLEPRFENGGSVHVYNAEPYTPQAMGHIPAANPFVTKLASLATDTVRRHACDAILAYYFEPYAVAGWLASRWTGRPLIVKHAGSDLDRLCRVPDLATTYKEILRSADAVVTQPRLFPRFLGMGVERRRLERDIPYSLPRIAFRPEDAALRVSPEAPRNRGSEQAHAASDAPAIGIYGKIGVSKGTFDLIASLGKLAREGLPFRLLAMIGEAQGRSLTAALQDAGIEDRATVLPMQPNWRVPEFIRACTAVCFLERDFPIDIHGPVIPREVLACGVCLVLSREIASKQRYRDQLAHGKNVLVVEDPKDHDEQTAILRCVIDDSERARAIGTEGSALSRSIEGDDVFISGWEALLARLSAGAAPIAPAGSPAAFENLIPDLASFLRCACPAAVAKFPQASSAESPFDTAVRFCDFVSERIARDGGDDIPKMLALLAYAKERLAASFDPADGTALFPMLDRLTGAIVSKESAWRLRPVRANSVRIVPFEYDVSGTAILSTVGGHDPVGADGAELAGLERDPILVLFHRSANLLSCELRIDEPTRHLVDCCDGSRTTEELTEEMCRYFGVRTPELIEEAAERVCGALDRLYRAGVLVFGEYREGGWAGGSRARTEHAAAASGLVGAHRSY
jgi:glycosyltransferase involved in cell wall biosynthesis